MGHGIVRASLHDQLVERLREMIVENRVGRRASGVDEKGLCEEFGISRTPLREALKVMASEGLIELLPNRSPSCRAVDPGFGRRPVRDDQLARPAGRAAGGSKGGPVPELRELRRAHQQMSRLHDHGDRVEYYRLNRQFHMGIVDLAGNSVLSLTYANLTGQAQRARFHRHPGSGNTGTAGCGSTPKFWNFSVRAMQRPSAVCCSTIPGKPVFACELPWPTGCRSCNRP